MYQYGCSDGEVHVTLKEGKPYSMWNIVSLAHHATKGVLVLKTTCPFYPADYSGRHRLQLHSVNECAHACYHCICMSSCLSIGPYSMLALLSKSDCLAECWHVCCTGYAHRRTLGFKQGESKSDNEEIQGANKTYVFRLQA